QAARMLVARLPELTRSRAIAHVPELPIPPAAAWFVSGFKKEIEGNDGPEGRMLIFLEGSARLLDRATRDVRSALGRAGVPETTIIDTGAHDTFARTIDAALATIAERSVTYRFGGLPDAVEKRCLDALARAADAGLTVDAMGDVLNGDCYVRVSARDARTFAEAIEAYDDALHAGAPNAVVVASAAPIRGSLDVWGADPNAIERMQALKHRFDPNAILNRGRFIGGI
ncbi:MAG: hypothetical protein JOZ38_12065, partial [Candidatus Eremiobacteraeota bacterium]|nr:hypothetical protein [Candidatus Eremiobacteraeota bacterium]